MNLFMWHRIIGAVKSRYMLMSVFVVFFGLIMVLRLFELQIIEGDRYVPKTNTVKETRKMTEIAPRGRIMDRNGVPIAVNTDIFTVHIVQTDLDDDGLNRVLLNIIDILEKNNDTWLKSLEKYLNVTTDDVPYFTREDRTEIVNWQKNMFKIDEADATEDPQELFDLLKSEKFFSIDGNYSVQEAYKIMSLRYVIAATKGAFDTGTSVCIARDVERMSIAEIEENSHNLKGVTIDIEPVREYHNALYAAHVLGYVGAINNVQYEELKDDGYGINDIIGQYGVEAQNEAYLRGRDGEKRIEILSGGNTASEIDGKPAIPGSDIMLTIDMDLQEVAMNSLEKNINIIRNAEFNGYNKTTSDKNFNDAEAGAVVAVDVHTGEILAMVSYPAYDPSIFLNSSENREAQQAIQELWQDPLNRSWNRAIQGTYSPGSTFKPLTGIAALEEGVIAKHTELYDAGRISIGERNLYCLEGGHDWQTLKMALEASCNVFFYEIGTNVGIDNLEKWAKQFGLGVKTGVDLPYEKEGIMSSKEYKTEKFSDIWRPADTAQVSIGQLYNSFTPLQMACYMSALANGGVYYKPYITKKIIRYDGSTVRETVPEMRKIPVEQEYIEAIKEGMVASTTEIDGTASQVFSDFPYKVAGKTGTAETGFESRQQSSNSLFVCYAPADDPQIAVAVVIEKGVWGSYTAPVARDILEAYFGLNDNSTEDDTFHPLSPGFVP